MATRANLLVQRGEAAEQVIRDATTRSAERDRLVARMAPVAQPSKSAAARMRLITGDSFLVRS
jgi:hypothetical protein